MIFVVVEEVIPESQRGDNTDLAVRVHGWLRRDGGAGRGVGVVIRTLEKTG